jgi:hypothetical protein
MLVVGVLGVVTMQWLAGPAALAIAVVSWGAVRTVNARPRASLAQRAATCWIYGSVSLIALAAQWDRLLGDVDRTWRVWGVLDAALAIGVLVLALRGEFTE